MMDELRCYKTMPVWNAQTLPEAFRRRHNTQAGTWARLSVLKGWLDFELMDEQGAVTAQIHCTPSSPPPRIEPRQWHRIGEVSADVECQLSFHCLPEDYFAKKHGLTRTHSEVIEAAATVAPGRALDLGCGNGRNVLYLAMRGFTVDAWDKDAERVANLRRIAAEEGLTGIQARQVDLEDVAIEGVYDFILSTVVLMFLQPAAAAALIGRMQDATVPGGCNLIVTAMDTPDCPCPVPFPCTFGFGELSGRYQGWELLKYNELHGSLHKTDAEGKPIVLRFATLLARKPRAS
ncbi:SAM-dependent methyltransferase TehB [Achromobacter aloeverae]